MPELYCLDTSVLIESWNRHYQRAAFPSFWRKMEDAIGQGVLISPEIVLDELRRKDDDLYAWAKTQSGMFVPLDEDLQRVHTEIINRFPRLVSLTRLRSLCDPWVIALAYLHQCPVVTMENPNGDNKPRIPDVCRHMGLKAIMAFDLIEALGWTF